jgi:isopenicillin N synthase-like dioxygenase
VTDYVPSIDLRPWLHGDHQDRRRLAERVDDALRTAGFLLITGHGVDPAVRGRVRAHAREFFVLPDAVKAKYAVVVGGRGWLPPDAEANGYAEGTATPPDMKESLSFAADMPIGDPGVDKVWFRQNTWPTEIPALRPALTEYLASMRLLADELMSICAVALGLPIDHFAAYRRHPTFGFNINWYPSPRRIGSAIPGQFRIGPHSDFGTVTILDREPGLGGLQVFTSDRRWVDAPFDPDAFTINLGDLMARWTGDRWRATRQRGRAPPAEAVDEELMSLVYFSEVDHDAVIESLPSPIGATRYPPVVWGDYLASKLAAISV